MLWDYGALKIELLGDPHLGKKFRNGVPLDRRGDREKTQWADFEASLRNKDCDIHVCMGDIFEDTVVPYEVVMRTAMMYRQACKAHPDRPYVLIRGNHDASRDLERTSAFDILLAMLHECQNFVGVSEHLVMRYVEGPDEEVTVMAFIPWHPIRTSVEMANDAPDGDIAFGHWDVVTVHDDHNRIPTEVLAMKGYKKVITGHDHLRRWLVIDNTDVFVTGSMQPYSHAEDPDGNLYVTLTLEELKAIDVATLVNKCVRVKLQKGETFSENINCLQLTCMREDQSDDDVVDVSVEFEEFDFNKLAAAAYAEAGVDPTFVEKANRKIDDARLSSPS
jgi:DNA repair exonuclease SbcCD nuclease subunit